MPDPVCVRACVCVRVMHSIMCKLRTQAQRASQQRKAPAHFEGGSPFSCVLRTTHKQWCPPKFKVPLRRHLTQVTLYIGKEGSGTGDFHVPYPGYLRMRESDVT